VRPRHVAIVGILVSVLLVACSGPPTGTAPNGSPTAAPDPFAGRTYRLDLPADWIVLGSTAYEADLDATPDVARWLDDLELSGPNAFRAHEPAPGAAGLRLAINPPVAWDNDAAGPLDNGELLAALPGVIDEPIGEWVAIGTVGKGGRFRWTQSLDWGSGVPSARACVGYQVLTEFDPVNVVFTYPAKTDRFAEIESMMATFEVLGSPTASLPPGATPTPSPTPYDKWTSPEPEPTPVSHADPALEARLPDSVDGTVLSKTSHTGAQLGMTDADPLLSAFDRRPADLAMATATPREPPLVIVSVMRLRGVPADDLLAAVLADVPDAEVSRVELAGRTVTYVEAGAWPVWYDPRGEYLYGVTAIDEATVGRILALLD
jgi:hypothetical protein